MLDYSTKILEPEGLIKKLNQQRLKGRRIAFTNGCFDLLHSGHLKVLFEARKTADFLVVGLNTDASVSALKGPSRPVKKQLERAECLAAMYFVDAVCFFDQETPIELIRAIMPDVLVKGGDYNVEEIVGSDLVQNHGGTVVTIPLVEGRSSSELILKMKNDV